MKPYSLLLWEEDALPADPPIAFCCSADDAEHAEEQAQNAYPGCVIEWCVEGSVQDVWDSYYGRAEV